MNLYNAGQRFGLNYAAYDLAEDLDIRFKVYDISSGTAVLLETLTADFVALGTYETSYVPVSGKIYLFIGLAYTGSTPTPYRAPVVYTYREVGSLMLATAYATYDQNDALYIQTSIYDASTSTPAFIQNTAMALVGFGVYLAMYIGADGKSYQLLSAVYTDNTYDTVDTNRAPLADGMDVVGDVEVVIELQNAVLEGQELDATLEAYVA